MLVCEEFAPSNKPAVLSTDTRTQPMQSPSVSVMVGPSEVPAELDEIWGRDLNKVSLPDYVKANSTTLTFPEKVRISIV
jgi:hypothetical protein